MNNQKYPRMREFFAVYLNQDFDLWGETIPEIVSCYKNDSPSAYHPEMIDEIDKFMQTHADDLDRVFEENYGAGFDPQLWGYTTSSFLEELKKLLRE